MRNIVITGGIGFELARQLHARGDNVIAVCWKSSLALEALGVPWRLALMSAMGNRWRRCRSG